MLAVLFAVLNGLLLIKEHYQLLFVPVLLAIVVVAILWFEKLLLAIVFLVPVSFQLSEVIDSHLLIDLFIPSEPLIVGVFLLFGIRILQNIQLDMRFMRHPVSIAILFYLTWMLLTTLTSTLPLVSFKLFLSRLWYISIFYVLFGMLFAQPKKIRQFVTLFSLGLTLVVFYALTRHAIYGIFEEKISHWSANPFFKDHTSYGALLAFFIPASITLAFYKGSNSLHKWLFMAVAVIQIIGLVFSYSRAAWLSLVAGFGLWVLIEFKIKFRWVLLGVSALGLVVFLMSDTILWDMAQNDQDSSQDLGDHVKSMTNVSTDASNLERLNRWHCAVEMFKEKPVVGWGPGTYMFKYAPFQRSQDLTIISTYQGDVGNAHSEYLGPLAEQGVFGPLLFLLVIALTLYYGIRAVNKTSDSRLHSLGLAAVVGLFTYYMHGFLNNFLDTDKASVAFWGFTALLVALDVYHKEEKGSISSE